MSIEVLEGKVLAIDASIWLTQFLKAMRDPDTGSVKPAAHLIGFFRRLAKLRFHGIRPVLVFDGATPIIKLRELEQRRRRREQFAPNSAGAVQRLAKRLLLQEIKKVKHAKAPPGGGGSAAPGFNLPEEEQQGTAGLASLNAKGEVGIHTTGKELEASSEEVARVLQEDEWRQQTGREKSLPPSSTLESSEEIARALQKEEWQGEQLVQGDDKLDESDWDKPISDPDQHEATKTQKGLKNGFQGKDKYDIEYIASLDSHNRKDAIEDAKRKQRMRSRQEFMPVAGQPEEYSAAQVRNFLRSTKLNKDIVKIAQQEAQKKASAGSAVASDPSRRVIFEKLDQKSKPPASKRFIRKQHNAEEESDSELEWEEGEEETASQSKKLAVLVDSSDEDDDQVIVERKQLNDISEKDENSESSKPADVLITIASSDESSQGGMPQHQQTVSVLEDSDDDDASGGGFLRDSSVVTASDQKQLRVSTTVARCEEGKAIASSNEDKQRLTVEGGGSLAGTLVRGTTSEAIARKGYDDDAISDEDDEDIAWEDGEGDSGSDRSNCAAKADGAADWFPKPEERTSNLTRDSTKSPHGNDMVSLEPNNRNQIALQQAQSTAANLTNWAGRAFRRAIAEQEKLSNMPKKEKMPDEKQTKAIADSALNSNPVDVEMGENQLIEIDISNGDDVEEDSRRSEAGHDEVLRNDDKSIDCHDKGELDDLTDVGKIGNHSNGTVAVEATDEKDSTNASATGGNPSELTAESLFEQEEELHKDLRRQEPDMDMMNDEMKAEIIALIALFGIPYVEAPAEAEAQCAALEALGLVDGIVTEDSDVFVFGGKTVYKNMFDDQKFVEVYKAEDAAKEMALDRNEMVALAMLLGGDYTSGVRGVGIVNSMEILGAFSMTKSTRDGLEQFRKWMDGFDPSDALASNCVQAEGRTALQKFHSTHRTARTRWICPEHFPAENVLNAYLNPIVDKSEDSFSWGKPDIDKLINFCSQKMGWEASDTSRMLEPLSNRLKEGMRQTRLDMFMDYSDNIQFANVRSKRLRSVLQGVTQDQPGQGTANTNSAKKARTSTKSLSDSV